MFIKNFTFALFESTNSVLLSGADAFIGFFLRLVFVDLYRADYKDVYEQFLLNERVHTLRVVAVGNLIRERKRLCWN